MFIYKRPLGQDISVRSAGCPIIAFASKRKIIWKGKDRISTDAINMAVRKIMQVILTYREKLCMQLEKILPNVNVEFFGLRWTNKKANSAAYFGIVTLILSTSFLFLRQAVCYFFFQTEIGVNNLQPFLIKKAISIMNAKSFHLRYKIKYHLVQNCISLLHILSRCRF